MLRRIYKEPKVKKHPLGKRPLFDQHSDNTSSLLAGVSIPSLKQITDKDKRSFMKMNIEKLIETLRDLFNHIKLQEPTFDYTHEQVSLSKSIFELYVNGNKKTSLKIWLSYDWSPSIKMAYGHILNVSSDSSWNEMIICEPDKNNELRLKMTMNIFGQSQTNSLESIVKMIWTNQLLPYLK